MNIVIQGSQGQGKTRLAQTIIQSYPDEAVLRIWNFRKKDQPKIEKFCNECADLNLVPLIVLEDLDRKSLTKALTFSKYLGSVMAPVQIDKIFITNERLNIS